MWAQADSSVSIPIPFLLNGQLIIPDAGSIKLTLRDNAGAALSGYDRLSQSDVSSTEMLLTIPSTKNGITTGSEFETRYVTVEYSSSGIPCFNRLSYNLAPFVPLSVEASDVRKVLGVEFDELPDSDIELMGSYFQLKADYGDNFTTALTSTSLSKLHANEAVVIREALRVFPSLQNRVLSSEKTDASEYVRMKGDLSKLKLALETRLNTVLTSISKEASVVQTVFMISSPTDPVTNS